MLSEVCTSFKPIFIIYLCDIKLTTLITLIGYYPPDHSIVTGGPNNLDSFEALLYVPSIFPFSILASSFAPTLIF